MHLAKQNNLLFPGSNLSFTVSMLCLRYALIFLGLLLMKASVIVEVISKAYNLL